jgi:ribosome-binding factor A
MSTPGRRQERFADQIRSEVAGIIETELNDPRIGFSTVTGVEVSADLSHARVMVSVLGDEEARRKSMERLSSAVGYVRHEITRRLRLRRLPQVLFVLDRGLEEGSRIEALIEKLHAERSDEWQVASKNGGVKGQTHVELFTSFEFQVPSFQLLISTF